MTKLFNFKSKVCFFMLTREKPESIVNLKYSFFDLLIIEINQSQMSILNF